MNPPGGGYNNPPPPGTEVCTEFEDENDGKKVVEDLAKSKVEEIRKVMLEYEGESSTSSKIKGESGEETKTKIDRIDPFLKNPEYLEYERRRHSRESSRHRRRSHSRSRHTDRRKRSKGRHRSRSRDRHRRSRSRSHRHRRHRSSSSSRSRHGKSKREKRHKQSSSRSRRYSRSHSRSRRHHIKVRHGDIKSDSEKEDRANTSGEVEEDDEPATKENAFKNDGSFLEMFKKMQEEQQKAAEAAKEQASSSESAAMIPPIAKRRGGRILKTGLVEKAKVIDEFMQGDGLDAWSVYMKEVKRYKEACCDDDSKTRPLVK